MPVILTYHTFNEKLPDEGRMIKIIYKRMVSMGMVGLDTTEGVFHKADFEIEPGEEDFPQPDFVVGDEEIFLDKDGDNYWVYTDDIYPEFYPDTFLDDWQWYLEHGLATFEETNRVVTEHPRHMEFVDGVYRYNGKVWKITIKDGNEVFQNELVHPGICEHCGERTELYNENGPSWEPVYICEQCSEKVEK